MITLRFVRLGTLTALSVIVAALAPAVCVATPIDNFPSTASLGTLGEPFAPYFAQTFKALPGVATDLAIELAGDSGPDQVEFHVLFTEVVGRGSTSTRRTCCSKVRLSRLTPRPPFLWSTSLSLTLRSSRGQPTHSFWTLS